ncbi:hypothetical protein GP475_05655 [Corynebacterium poyangense]|uniref:Uncharacterized protein n=1 Tax=Corynebacterium poyangense TaxID=2684405 RepID=A0A7H0SNQ9_9CORY|nr:hypothetical protein [Corynebacterium poyangense]QNQ90184.1 hypothetical protein GP475_05655 [Corynebacterium poyangense]
MNFSKAAALLSGIMVGLALAIVILSFDHGPTSEQDNAQELEVTTPPTETMTSSVATPSDKPAFSGPQPENQPPLSLLPLSNSANSLSRYRGISIPDG